MTNDKWAVVPRAVAVAVTTLLPMVAACAAYRPVPLDPPAELAALRGRTLEGFVVERAAPGGGRPGGPPTFDPSDGLDDAELAAVALTLNPDLRAKRAETGQAGAALIAAGVWPNPELGASWRPGAGAGVGTAAEADLLFAFLRPGERAARRDAAEARVREAEAEAVAAEWRIVAEVRSRRLDAVVAGAAAALLDEEVALRERVLDLARRRRELGEGTLLDVALAELELAEVRRDRIRAEAEGETARRELNRTLGLPPEYALKLAGDGAPPVFTLSDDLPDAELERRLLEGRFELRAGEAACRAAEEDLRLAVLRQYPHAKFGPSFGREPEGEKTRGAGLGIEIPLFDRNQGEIADKEAARDRARAAYVALLHRLRADAHEARGRVRRAREEVERQEREVRPLLERTEALFEGALRARELGVFEWAAARQRVLKARREALEALARHAGAAIELDAALGAAR